MTRRPLYYGLLALALAMPGCTKARLSAVPSPYPDLTESTAAEGSALASAGHTPAGHTPATSGIEQTSAESDGGEEYDGPVDAMAAYRQDVPEANPIEQIRHSRSCDTCNKPPREGREGRDRDGGGGGGQCDQCQQGGGGQGGQGGNKRISQRKQYQNAFMMPCMAPQLFDARVRRHPILPSRRAKRIDNRVNPDGCHPEREFLPPLKRIADEENKKSSNKAIKIAAEIKEQEDLACQKIKALKYLGMIGCCVYDEDGKITEAFVAALGDPTPLVRKTAIEVISGEYCGKQYHHGCKCKKEIVEKLADMAWGVKDDGQCKEPLPAIRQMAAQVVFQCCPNCAPGSVPQVVPEQPVVPKTNPEIIPEEVIPVNPAEKPPVVNPADKSSAFTQPPQFIRVEDLGNEGGVETANGNLSTETIPMEEVTAGGLKVNGLRGTIDAIDGKNAVVSVQLEKPVTLPKGTRLVTFHRYVLGNLGSVVEYQVVSASPGCCFVRPVGNPSVSRAAIGGTLLVVSPGN